MRRLTTSFVALVIVLWFMYLWIVARQSTPPHPTDDRGGADAVLFAPAPAGVGQADPLSASRSSSVRLRSTPHR